MYWPGDGGLPPYLDFEIGDVFIWSPMLEHFGDFLKLAVLAFLFVMFISINTRNVVNDRYKAAFFTQFVNAIVWTFIITTLATSGSSWGHRLSYALGSSFGTICGMYIESKIFSRNKKSDKTGPSEPKDGSA